MISLIGFWGVFNPILLMPKEGFSRENLILNSDGERVVST